MSEQKVDFETLHKKLGCYGCKFADKNALGKDACCQHIEGVLTDKDGVCTRRVSITGEKNQDWKETRIIKYAQLEANRKAVEKRWDNDIVLNELQVELKEVLDKIEETEKPYRANIDAIAQQEAGIKLELAKNWNIEDKMFVCNMGTAILKTTKSLHIQNKEKLVNFLIAVNKLPDYIKGFEIAKLRKVKDAGLLEDEVASWDEKKSVAISLKEKTAVEAKK